MSAIPAIVPPVGSLADAQRLNRRVARTLRLGVATGGSLIAVGLLARLAAGGSGLLTRSPALDAASLADLFHHPSGLGLTLLGTLVLAATPLVRVGLSCEYFARVGDRDFTALTLFVLVILLSTILAGVLG